MLAAHGRSLGTCGSARLCHGFTAAGIAEELDAVAGSSRLSRMIGWSSGEHPPGSPSPRAHRLAGVNQMIGSGAAQHAEATITSRKPMSAALTYAIKFRRQHGRGCPVPHNASWSDELSASNHPSGASSRQGKRRLPAQVPAEHPACTCQLGFRVSEIDRFYSSGPRKGIEAVAPPPDLHGQRIAKLRDPDGAEFSVSGT
jgi:hypothetical protein